MSRLLLESSIIDGYKLEDGSGVILKEESDSITGKFMTTIGVG